MRRRENVRRRLRCLGGWWSVARSPGCRRGLGLSFGLGLFRWLFHLFRHVLDPERLTEMGNGPTGFVATTERTAVVERLYAGKEDGVLKLDGPVGKLFGSLSAGSPSVTCAVPSQG